MKSELQEDLALLEVTRACYNIFIIGTNVIHLVENRRGVLEQLIDWKLIELKGSRPLSLWRHVNELQPKEKRINKKIYVRIYNINIVGNWYSRGDKVMKI